MAKNLFRASEVTFSQKKVYIDAPYEEKADELELEEVDEYTGPTSDDLRREAEAFKARWEEEKAEMLQSSQEEAQKIIAEAEETAFSEMQKKLDEAAKEKQQILDEAREILDKAKTDAAVEINEAQQRVADIKKNAYDTGYNEGHEAGYGSGKAELKRLVDQLHTIISRTIEKRNEIIEESETQLISLVLQIAKKVVKVISENQKNVVVNNVIQALRKLKSRGDVVLRVNLEDVQLTSDHTKDFLRMVENVRSITVIEDSTVDKGGCIIETDFGQIDARISSQFQEIEEKILELVPIKAKSED